MQFQQVQYSVDTIVNRINSGRMALPEFQRDFIWSPSQVVELLDSVARQWPIGSLLLLAGPQSLAYRPIIGAPGILGEELDLYILDGQQRITSLYHAVTDISDYCYYIDFNVLRNGDEDFIKFEKRRNFQRKYPSLSERARYSIALIKDIWDMETFFEWFQMLPDPELRSTYLSLRSNKLVGLSANVYKVTSIDLDHNIELGALARIFETLNRTGVALNAFDLMVATLYPNKFNLRDEWDKLKEQSHIIYKFNPSEIEVLKLIALRLRVERGKRYSPGVRQGDILKLNPNYIIDDWHSASILYSKALTYVYDYFGVTCSELIPSWSMILGVAMLLESEYHSNAMLIEKWWKTRLLTQHFSQAANTRIVADVDLMFAKDDGDLQPFFNPFSYFISQFENTLSLPENAWDVLLTQPARTNGLIMRGMSALIVRYGGKDPVSGQPLNIFDSIAFRAYDDKNKVLRRIDTRDTLANIVVISKESDIYLGKSADISKLIYAVDCLNSQGIYKRERSEGYFRLLFSVEGMDKT